MLGNGLDWKIRRLGILVVLLGILLGSGCSFDEAKWLSQEIANAQARQMNVQTDHQVQVNQTDQRLYDAEVSARIAQLTRQDELEKAEQAERLGEIEARRAHEQALRQAEIEHQTEVNRKELALLEQQYAIQQAQAEYQRMLHEQELAQITRQAELKELAGTLLAYAIFAGTLMLFSGATYGIVRRGWVSQPSARTPVNLSQVDQKAGNTHKQTSINDAIRWKARRLVAQANERARRQRESELTVPPEWLGGSTRSAQYSPNKAELPEWYTNE